MIDAPRNFDYQRAKAGVIILLESLFGEKILEDPNFKNTPQRIVESLLELSRGIFISNPDKVIKDAIFPTKYKGIVAIDPIFVSGLCPHHLLPIEYKIYSGYIPENKAVGLSKISRLIESLAARPVLQEDLTTDIANVFQKYLKPHGVIIVIRGRHLCMRIRGVKQRESETTTSMVRGAFKENQSTRDEFFKLTNLGR